jgi:DNA repair protein SbcC/Rad50
MRPVRLLLDGFGCYRQATEADFSDVDFFVLVGPTGSGKSTLIDGLCFALYGTRSRRTDWKTVTISAPSRNCSATRNVETTMIYTHVMTKPGKSD